jgi:hypothetical protein
MGKVKVSGFVNYSLSLHPNHTGHRKPPSMAKGKKKASFLDLPVLFSSFDFPGCVWAGV